nr:MAG: capsid protein precursor [Astroviridae sp.]
MAPTTAAASAGEQKMAKKTQKKRKMNPGRKQKVRQQKQKMRTQPAVVTEVKKVERKMKRLEKKTNGPKIDDKMTTTVTLGIIVGQDSDGLNRQMRIPFNPLLMKASDGANTTPLSIRGSMYEMWKVLYAEVKAVPLSGASNVVGSVGFMALTLNGLEAGADSIDSVKARRHVQMPLGRAAHLRLKMRELEGPREGWWLVDTSEDPAEAYGPAVDLLLAYPTHNLLQTTGSNAYLGTLWQVELRATYAFSTYHPKPGLQSLVSETLDKPANVTIGTESDGSLIMTTSDTRLLSLFDLRERHFSRNGQTGGKSQTVWAVAGSAVEAASAVLGPWGWLLKGGFWLVRKIFGGSGRTNASTKFQIYPSITAAASDQPIYGGTGTKQVTIPVVHVSEVINPNSESNVATNPVTSGGGGGGTELPFRPLRQPDPVYDSTNDAVVSKSYVGAFLFGNWRWQLYSQSDDYNFEMGVQITRKACAYAHLTELQGMVAGARVGSNTGPGGILGTAHTWLNAMLKRASESQYWWPANLASHAMRMPNEVVQNLGIGGVTYGGPIDVFSTVTESSSSSKKLHNQGFLLFSTNGAAGIVVFMDTNESAMIQRCLKGPVVVSAARNITWENHELNTITESQIEGDNTVEDDEISLCDSFMGEQEKSPDEVEREFLLSRLRELDLRRFEMGGH